MAEQSGLKELIASTKEEIRRIGTRLIETTAERTGEKATGASVHRWMVREGQSPARQQFITWVGIGDGRVSCPGPRSAVAAESVRARVGELLGAEAADELARLWTRLGSLKKDAVDEAKTGPRTPPNGRHLDTRERCERAVQDLLAGGKPPGTVADLDLKGLFRLGSEVTDSEVPPYVTRTADAELRRRLEVAFSDGSRGWERRAVLASGAPKAGKTRSLLENLRSLDDCVGALALVKAVTHAPLGALATALHEARAAGAYPKQKIVVIVEDLHLLLEQGSNISNDLRLLLDGPFGRTVVLVGTIHDSWLAMSDDTARSRGVRIEDRDLLSRLSVHYEIGLDPTEEHAAREMFSASLESGQLHLDEVNELPARCAAIGELDKRVGEALGDKQQYDHAALVHAVLDAAIIEPTGTSSELLFILAARWLTELFPTRPRLTEARFAKALDWATEPIGTAWAVVNRALGDETSDDRWRLLDAIAERRLPAHEPIQWLEEIVPVDEQFRIGNHWGNHGKFDAASRIFLRLAEAGDTSAMFNLGVLFYESGDVDGAEEWYRTAAAGGETSAMSNLGTLLEMRGDVDGAKEWYRRAAEGGNTTAMSNLGVLFYERGDVDGAEEWSRKAAEGGETGAMSNLGSLLKERGDLEGAEEWYRKAVEASETAAMINLGILLEMRGDLGGAEEWYRKASEGGETNAMFNLGILLNERGDLGGAEQWYRKSAKAGAAAAMAALGELFEDRGDLGGAEEWYRKGAEGGGAHSMNSLGRLAGERGDLAGAEEWYRLARDAGWSDEAGSNEP